MYSIFFRDRSYHRRSPISYFECQSIICIKKKKITKQLPQNTCRIIIIRVKLSALYFKIYT